MAATAAQPTQSAQPNQPTLETAWYEKLGDTFNSVIEGSIGLVNRLFGSANDRMTKNLGYFRPKGAVDHQVVPGSLLEKVNQLEDRMKALSDDELKAQTDIFRERLRQGETLERLMPEAFAACREAGRRTKGMRHYDTQIIGGAILHYGNIAEMVTGEGKTLVATLPAYLNALEGKGVHVVTVNDYLARRDCEWMLPIFNALGINASFIQSDMSAERRKAAYDCDITYGTNSEFGFDYLRDNMKPARFDDPNFHPVYRQCQRVPLNFAIIDEVDNVLIDEARTPLIISGPAQTDPKNYEKADEIARKLTELERQGRKELQASGEMKFQGTEGNNLPVLVPIDPTKVDPQNPPPKGVYFEIKEKEKTCHLTDLGVREAESLAGVESFYTPGNMEWPHLIDNALKAHHIYQQDRDYMLAADPRENNELGVIIIDTHTGRAMFGRQWSDGLHQSVEAKHKRDGVRIKRETQTLATITLQNFFKLYNKLAGMTGTAMTEANEFWKIYKLDVIAVPTNRPLQRVNYPDLVYKNEKEKWDAVIEEIIEVHNSGRPVLVGTTDVAKSEMLATILKRRGIKHDLLNAKPENVAREAEIVSQAGRMGAVTISTNMAGRGTDIILGGNPETLAWSRLKVAKDSDGRPLYPTRLEVPDDIWMTTVHEIETKEKMKEEGRKIAELGGLHIVGTERHESRRIDNQLRGRAGRQGDPGSSRFFLSLEDPLMRMFGGERIQRLMSNPWLGMKDGEALESGMLTRQIEKAQRRVEEYHFEQRKNLLDYDEVMDYQRKRTYGTRQSVLDGKNPRLLILGMIDERIVDAVQRYTDDTYGPASFASYASTELGIELEAKDFRGCSYEEAVTVARDRASQAAPVFVQEMIDENLNPDEDPKDWKWQELSRAVGVRYGLKVSERELKQIGAENVSEYLLEEAEKAIDAADLTAGERYLTEEYPLESLADWARQKFGLIITLDESKEKDVAELTELLRVKVREAYKHKDVHFPVQVALSAYLPDKVRADGRRPNREELYVWARNRFPNAAGLDEDAFRTESRSRITQILTDASTAALPTEDYPELTAKLEEVFSGTTTAEPEDATELSDWCQIHLRLKVDADKLTSLTQEACLDQVLNAYDLKYRPEMHDVERRLILETLDGTWKSHLMTMEHLRTSVGLSGYAQEDPKIVYKREGMKLFGVMWQGVNDKVTESIFRMEDVGEDQIEAAMWAGTRAIHQQAASAMQARPAPAGQPDQQTNNSGQPQKVETIRNVGKKVGRNDPCPCGSGKKYKNCHMKIEARK